MKFLYCLAAFSLVAALPSGPLGGRLITDPDRLVELEAKHADALAKMKRGEAYPVLLDEAAQDSNGELEERFIPAVGIAGMWLTLAGRGNLQFLERISSRLKSIFGKNYAPWTSTEHCRVYFQTHRGTDGYFKTWPRDTNDPGSEFSSVITWHYVDTTDPPVRFFENDHLGVYSVQFTATDRVAWDGIDGTDTCLMEGICNPQYIFYHSGYNILLNTWLSEGDLTSCQYSHGEDCKGVCWLKIIDQFASGGMVWGGDCAVPCINDGGDGGDDEVDAPDRKARIMIAGDSISHGMTDDHTWRYRLYQWLKDTLHYEVEFVGPFKGTHGPRVRSGGHPPLLPGETAPVVEHREGRFADGVNFPESGHASKWGRQAAQTKNTIGDWVREHQPEYLLLLLGFNDLGWWVSGPEGLVGNMGQLVEAARKAKPDIKILVGNVVDRTFIEGRQDLVDNTKRYNELLRQRLHNWFRWESPITYVDVNSYYNCRPGSCPDGYDGLHPNALGEYHIAQAFARSLRDNFGFTGPDFAVPSHIPPRVVTTPTNVRSTAHVNALCTNWDEVRNARGYEMRSRVKGSTGWWSEGPAGGGTTQSCTSWVINGQTWEFQVRTRGDNDVRSEWAGLTSATANLQTSPGPPNIVVVPSGDGIQVTWGPVVGYNVNRYNVIYLDLDTEGAFIGMKATTGLSQFVGGFRHGHRYAVWVETWVTISTPFGGLIAGGLPGPASREVIIGAGAPSPPTNLRVTNVDPTTVRLHWDGSAGASGYGVFYRSVRDNTAFRRDGQTKDTTYGVWLLFPGTWHHEFCVSAYNGNLETAHTACAIPPVYPGFQKRDEVGDESQVDGSVTVATNTSMPYNSTGMMDDERLLTVFNLLSQSVGTDGDSPPDLLDGAAPPDLLE